MEILPATLDELTKAICLGWSDAEHTAGDKDLESLHDMPEFEAILRQLRKDDRDG